MKQVFISSDKQAFTIGPRHFADQQIKKAKEQVVLAKRHIHHVCSSIKKEFMEQIKRNGERFIHFNDFY